MANLIGFDKNRDNVEFRGHCKLSINFMSNYLYVEPKNEAFKLISASFKWNYVMKKNILFVFAEHNFLDFCLVFKNVQICRKTLDYIASRKNDTEVSTEERSIDDGFIIPIFQRIAENPTFQTAMIETIAAWHQLLDEDDKQKYTQMMTDYGIYDLIMTAVPAHEKTKEAVAGSRKRKFLNVKKEIMPKIEMETEYVEEIYSTFVPASQFKLIKRHRFRRLIVFTSDEKEEFHEYLAKSKYDKFKCITCDQTAIIDLNENGEIVVGLDNDKHSCKLSNKIPSNYMHIKMIRKPDYQIFENCGRFSSKILVVFNPDDSKQCCDYFLKNKEFYCRGCIATKLPNKSSAFIFNEGTSKEYVGIINGNHECKSKKFQLENYREYFDHVNKPYFEFQKFIRNGKESKRLIIFNPNDRSKCYRYIQSNNEKYYCYGCISEKKRVAAKSLQNSEGEEYILLSNVKHVCEMKNYVSDKTVSFLPPKIEVMEETENGTSRVFLFENGDQSKCYVFNKHENSHYYCVGCKSKTDSNRRQKKRSTEWKNVRGKLLKNKENGEYSFQMKPNQIHLCEPRPYQPEKYVIQSVSKTSDFFYYRLKNEPKTVKLAIYSQDDNQLCFPFVYHKARNSFACVECQKLNKFYSMKPQKDAYGEEYFNHNLKKHYCKPVNVSSIPKDDILKESGLSFESKSKKNFDESKKVKKPNFELRSTKAGIPDKKLIILHPTDKTLCYNYYFNNAMKMFLCGRCMPKTTVSAKLLIDEENGESFILMGKNGHVCEPFKYQPM